MTDPTLGDQSNDLAGDMFPSVMDPIPSFSSHNPQDFSLPSEKEDTLRQMLSSGSGDNKPTNPHHAPMTANASYMPGMHPGGQMGMGGGGMGGNMGTKGQGMMPQIHPMGSAHHYPTPPGHHPGMGPAGGYRSYRPFSKPMMAQFQAQLYAYRYLTDRKQVPDNVLQMVAGRYMHPTDPHRMMPGSAMGRYPPRPPVGTGTSSNPGSGAVDNWMSSLGYGESSSHEPVPNVTVSSSSVIPTASSNQSTLPPELKLSLPIPPPAPPQAVTTSLSKTSSETTPSTKSLSSPATPISKPLSTPSRSPFPHKMTSPQQLASFQGHPHPSRPAKTTTVEKPQGLDPAELLVEREKRLKAGISQRVAQLEGQEGGRPEIGDRIELKGLRLLAFQKELRYDIVQLMNRETTLETALNLRAYKIPKRQTLKDAASTERLEKFHRKEAEDKQRQRHDVFLNELMTHAKEFREFHKGIQMRISKLKRDVVGHFDRLEREQKRLEKERMMKLMAEDDDGYKKLIDEKKNHRLAFLLKQTDEHIGTMRQLVMEHQVHQKKIRRDQRRKALLARFQGQGAGSDELNKVRIPVWCHEKGMKKEGQEAPAFDDLEQFLEDNPGWKVMDSDGEMSDVEEGDQRGEGEAEEVGEVRQSVGAESDTEEDKHTSTILAACKRVEIEDGYGKKGGKGEESTYYAMAHSYQEEIREQPNTLIGGTLKEYQVKGLEWMVSLYNNNLNGILADEMGLGKTIQTIALFAYLMEKKGVNGPHLVVVPLSTMFNWCMEFRKWAPGIIFIDYKGDPQVRKGHQNLIKAGKFNVLITTYDYVMKDKSCLSKVQWKYMIIDEGHRMKNHHCKLTQILNQYYQAPHRVLLTGTPLQNNLPELWALLNFLLPSIFKSCTSFEQWFNASFANTGERVELNEEETILIIRRLHKALRPFLLRRLKKEVEAQLPDKVEYVIKCDTSALQKVVYRQLQDGGLLIDTSGKVKKHSLNNIIVQLRKLCNHPFMFERIENSICQHLGYEGNTIPQNSPLIYRASGKFELLDRILPKFLTTNHRVLLFCQMTDLMTILEDYLSWKGWKDKYIRLDGHTKPDERCNLLQLFNVPSSPYFIFLLSTRAGGLGLNLQSADTVIIFDSDWNPHQDLQAQDRAHRIGQANEVRVLRLITTNSVEEKILATAKFKLNVDIKVIQAGMFDNKSTSKERRDFLVTLLEDERIEEEEDPIPDEETLNRMIARSEEEFQLFQRMDAERITRESMDETLRHSSRLMQEDELPEYLLRDTADLVDVSDQEMEETLQGKGHRVRDKVNYCEISDTKWLKTLNDPALEEGDEVYAKNRKRKTGGDSSNEGTPPSKKIRKKQVRSKVPISMELIREMMRVWQEVVYFEDDEGRQLSDIFMELPSKRELPDYYQIISQPIDLKRVKNKVLKGAYREWDEFDSGMKIMFHNARQYNMETSRIYEDSKILEDVFQKARNDLEMEVLDVNDLIPDVQNELDAISNPKLATGSSGTKKKRGRPGRPRKIINQQQVDSDEDSNYL